MAAQTALSVEGQARGETALRLQLTGSAATATEIVGREVVIRFADPISPQGVDETARNFPTWIATIEYGYDSLVVRFGPAVQVTTEPTANGLVVAVSLSPQAETRSNISDADPQRIRLDYYRALTLIESGALTKGRALLVGLHRSDPRNLEVMLLLARAEERLGRPARALTLYDKALALDPRLPGAIRDRLRLARDLADTARISTRYQDVENGETQIITTLDGRITVSQDPSLSYTLENRTMEAGAVTQSDGSVGRFEGDRQRGVRRQINWAS